MISIQLVQSVIDSEDPLAFSYPSSEDGSLVRRVLSPWLLEKDDTILKGYDHDKERVRRFALTKIEHAYVLLDEEFVRPA